MRNVSVCTSREKARQGGALESAFDVKVGGNSAGV